jgi:DNA uptake protein ComE-like DNA-binding protein
VPHRRRGVVLVLVLIVVAVLSLAAYAFSDVMLAENEMTHIVGKQIQAYSLAASGVASVRAFLMRDAALQAEAGGIYDNAATFQAVSVASEEGGEAVGMFSVLAPALDAEGNATGARFGLEDESARVNLNVLVKLEEQALSLGQDTLIRDLLLALPGMTAETADAILDWIDEDDTPREFGAEADYYAGLSPPYAPKNSLLETVEELLLVRGVTPQLLFGADVNRNGMIDQNEMDQALQGADSESVSRGWASLLTLHSKEKNFNSAGEQRINLNMDELQQLNDALSLVLSTEQAMFIIAYRLAGPYEGEEEGEAYSSGELDLGQEPKTEIKQVLDLVGARVEIQFQGQEEATILKSPFGDDVTSMATYMTTLMDVVTAVDAPSIPGRININQAPREIMTGIPGMTEELLEQIISMRTPEPELEDPSRQHETWLLAEGLVTLDEMRTLLPFVCAGGDVYRTQVVGFYDDGQASSRLEVLLDATEQPPRLLLWRDISHLGRGFSLETLGAALQDPL